ncbi:cyclic nucleotide-binding/CBS domain-containing protein [Rhodoferax sp.]|jgi:CBS domain-containing protein|uniref:CBS domain-containing protein n=1 Tax=Rhodoferax sp. TaxID=50421 RepID=UPI002728114A|nr:CBS domain-containing protein [Rhodoferax sp.]MDO9143079.1 CBS domain-containing protein [Rhodoferax sp.]MDP1528208.1 CBS domain-containing protein [Rhodoferax sp.]MDP1943085.1 CBS domain-containing protein [Rhodoferax sp.]MDP2443103.1 CBS domain-containing protein [Rhodoferax sp.]MDP3191265.1 CBS domain-containing protein [Rhodoferax sp.]
MFDLPIRSVMERKKFITAAPNTTVSQAARLMATKNAGAVLVVEDDQLIGIFTERDVVFRVIALGLDPRETCLRQVMTADPKTLSPNQCYGHALVIMQENGFRHVPVVEENLPIGIISSRNAMDPDLEEFVADQRRREHYR